jgi:D-methionine transport system ATP-binding protein
VISFKNVVKTIAGNSILNNINLDLAPGKIVALIGSSGAGKSTLLQCVNGLVQPDSGHVLVDNTDISNLDNASLRIMRKRIGMIFQNFNLLSSRTALGNVLLPLELEHDYNAQNAKILAAGLLDRVGLGDRKKNYPLELSGGQKQRVAIARALATVPDVMLCDEITSALDPAATIDILNLLRDIQQEKHLSILMVTHEIGVVKRIADEVVLLDNGQVIEHADILDFFAKPKTALARNHVIKGLHLDVPEPVASKLKQGKYSGDNDKLLRLTFVGEQSCDPIISDLTRLHNVSTNILQANIEYIRDAYLGFTLCEMSGKAEKINAAISNMKELGVRVEILDV